MSAELGELDSNSSSRSGGFSKNDTRSSFSSGKYDVSKILAQNNDLKKLLIEEQRKFKQTEDERRKKDQELRRLEAEMDGFRFRNDQLLKRIEFLQSEISTFNGKPSLSHSGKTKQKNGDPRNPDGVVEEELMKRIQENSDLRSRLENLEFLQNEQSDLTAKRMNALESELQASEKKHEKATSGLRQERDMLSNRVNSLEKSLQQTISDKDSTISMLEAKVASLEGRIAQDKNDATDTNNNILSKTICPAEYNQLNLNSNNNSNTHSVNRSRNLSFTSFSMNAESLILSLSAYGTAMLSLVLHSGASSSTLDGNFNKTKSLLELIPQPNSSLVISEVLPTAAATIDSLACLIRDFLASCDASFQSSSHDLSENLFRLGSLLGEAINMLSSSDEPATVAQWLRLAQLSSAAAGIIHDHYAALVVSMVGRAELKPSLDSALQALGTASSSLESLSTLLDAKARSVDVSTSYLSSASNALKQNFSEKTTKFLSRTRIPEKPVAIEYSRAIELECNLEKTEAERSALADRTERILKRLKTAEEEREKWLVEAQLRQVRYEKLLQRVTGASAKTDVSLPSVISSSISMSGISNVQANSELSDPTVSSSQNSDVVWVTNHFGERISLVSTDAQRADSEAACWKAESRSLISRIIQARKLADKIRTLESSLRNKDDELETVKSSYENQLAAMAEHLATMNERIIKQADDAEALQRQLRIQHQHHQSTSSNKHSRRFLGKPS